jgi:hypothetical protein
MATKCKVCQSPLRKEIEKQIVDGVSYVNIEDFTRSQKQPISHMSIKRHNDAGHIDGFKRVGNPDYQEESGIDASEVESSLDNMCIDIPNVQNADDLKTYTRSSMLQITANQLAIIRHKQEKFMKGQGRYPQNEIMGLRTIIVCLDGITDRRGQVLNVESLTANLDSFRIDKG